MTLNGYPGYLSHRKNFSAMDNNKLFVYSIQMKNCFSLPAFLVCCCCVFLCNLPFHSCTFHSRVWLAIINQQMLIGVQLYTKRDNKGRERERRKEQLHGVFVYIYLTRKCQKYNKPHIYIHTFMVLNPIYF